MGGQGFKSEYKPTQVKFVGDINEGYDRGGKTVCAMFRHNVSSCFICLEVVHKSCDSKTPPTSRGHGGFPYYNEIMKISCV